MNSITCSIFLMFGNCDNTFASLTSFSLLTLLLSVIALALFQSVIALIQPPTDLKPCFGLAKPLIDPKTGRTGCCGFCLPRMTCPRNYFCHAHPADRFAVCCPKRVQEKPGTCPTKPRFGICVNLCSHDSQCKGRKKCCKNGCGKRCRNPCPMLRCPQRDCRRHGGPRYFPNGCRGCGCVCPWNKPFSYCFINPCRYARCPNYPYARCKPNYCGGCHAEFYIGRRKVNCKKCPGGRRRVYCK